MKSALVFDCGCVRHARHIFGKFGIVACAVFAFSAVQAADEPGMAEHHHHHHDHGAMAPASGMVMRSQVAYELPAVKMVRQDGQSVSFANELNDGRPVILNFIYTSCTAICPVSSQIMASVQSQLAKIPVNAHLVSVSIDPEFDTPERLRVYAKSYNADAQWNFYTGSANDSVTIQKAFDAYRGDKMNHIPVTFIRLKPGMSWVRLEGFASPERIIQEYRALSGG